MGNTHMFNDFRKFILRGNVMDLAVGVIIGAAFGKIVSSLVADLLMPVIGAFMGGADFSNLQVKIGGTAADPVFLTYGKFIQTTIDFLFIGLVIFFIVRLVNKLHKPVPATTKPCPRCTLDVALAATRCPHCTTEFST